MFDASNIARENNMEAAHTAAKMRSNPHIYRSGQHE